MLQIVDRALALTVLVFLIGLLIAFAVRRALGGPVRFARTDAIGNSPLLSRWVLEFGHWFLQPVARVLAAVGVSANGASWLSLVLGAGTGIALALGLFGTAAFLGSVSGLLDTVDGMLARLTGTSSDAGEVLDAAVDRYAEAMFLVGLSLHYRDRPVLALLALAAMAGSFMISYATAKAEALNVEPPGGLMRRQERTLYLTGAALATGLLSPALERALHLPEVGIPMVGGVLVVAVLANVSSILRYRALIRVLQATGRGPRSEPAHPPN